LKKNCLAPADLSQSRALSAWRTARMACRLRNLSATTTASASAMAAMASPRSGTPIIWTVRMPLATRVLQRSVAPVMSSATAPKRMRFFVPFAIGGLNVYPLNCPRRRLYQKAMGLTHCLLANTAARPLRGKCNGSLR
jgi:hypothetical protein